MTTKFPNQMSRASMNASDISADQYLLPMFSEQLAGVIWSGFASDLSLNTINRGSSNYLLTGIVDIRKSSAFGDTSRSHQEFCDAIDHFNIKYLRLGHVIAKAERSAQFNFQEKELFFKYLDDEPWLIENLEDILKIGSILFIRDEIDIEQNREKYFKFFLEKINTPYTRIYSPKGLWVA